MKVTGYTNFFDSRYKDIDVIKPSAAEWAQIDTAVKESIRTEGIKISPDYHQNGVFGTPVIDNKYRVTYSLREFSRLLSEVYGGDYLDYYCQEFDEEILPRPELCIDLPKIEDIYELKENVCIRMSEYKHGWLPLAQKQVKLGKMRLRKAIFVLSLQGVNRALKNKYGLNDLISAKTDYDAAKEHLAKRIEGYKKLRVELKEHERYIKVLKGGKNDD